MGILRISGAPRTAPDTPRVERAPATFPSTLVRVCLVCALASWGCEGKKTSSTHAKVANTDARREPSHAVMPTRPLTLPSTPNTLAPRFVTGTDTLALTWIEAPPDDATPVIRLSERNDDGGWSPARPLIRDPAMLVNWADVPAAHRLSSGGVALAYPRHHRVNERAYGLSLAVFTPDLVLHDQRAVDGVTTGPESGFATFTRDETSDALWWLDGRALAGHAHGQAHHTERRDPPGAMALRMRRLDAEGAPAAPSLVIDPRTCECCKLDADVGPRGPTVVYRDRDDAERRDVRAVTIPHATNLSEGESPALASLDVHRDGWEIAGCPVNGPAIAHAADVQMVAWMTAAQGVPRVFVSRRDGRLAMAPFEPPTRVDLGEPTGRVDLIALDARRVLVTWIEADPDTPGQGALLARVFDTDGMLHPPVEIARLGTGRASGFPRARRRGDEIVWVWTQTQGDATLVTGRVGLVAALPGGTAAAPVDAAAG